MKGPQLPVLLCIGALLVAGSPCSDGQTSPIPTPTDSSTKIPINSPDDRFFLYEDVSHPGGAPQHEVIRIDDPVGGQRYMIFPHEKSMFVLPFVDAAGAVVQQPLAPPPPTEGSLQRFLTEFGGDAARAPGKPVAKTRPLGKKTFDGVSAVGERRTYTVPGKDAPIRIESEQWFSPELGVVVMNAMSVWVSPRANMKVTYRLQITRGEPDPAQLRVPEGYTKREMDR